MEDSENNYSNILLYALYYTRCVFNFQINFPNFKTSILIILSKGNYCFKFVIMNDLNIRYKLVKVGTA